MRGTGYVTNLLMLYLEYVLFGWLSEHCDNLLQLFLIWWGKEKGREGTLIEKAKKKKGQEEANWIVLVRPWKRTLRPNNSAIIHPTDHTSTAVVYWLDDIKPSGAEHMDFSWSGSIHVIFKTKEVKPLPQYHRVCTCSNNVIFSPARPEPCVSPTLPQPKSHI